MSTATSLVISFAKGKLAADSMAREEPKPARNAVDSWDLNEKLSENRPPVQARRSADVEVDQKPLAISMKLQAVGWRPRDPRRFAGDRSQR